MDALNQTRNLAQRNLGLLTALALSAALSGCDSKPEQKNLAPESQALSAAEGSESSLAAKVEQDKSSVTFKMDAELELINGRAPKSVSGELKLDPEDLSKLTGLLKIDLLQLSLFQQKRGAQDEDFGKEVRNEKQNEHMRTWLQISPDGPEEQREKNRFAEFKVEKVTAKGEKNLSKLSGTERQVQLDVSGSLRLHGRVTEHSFPAEATFVYQENTLSSVRFEGQKPISVSLEKHDVRPRKAFDILADKTLDALGSKVSKVAEVSLDITANLRP